MERTIRVTGKGKLSVKPDLIELTLSIKDIQVFEMLISP